jgi:hypothetical protein
MVTNDLLAESWPTCYFNFFVTFAALRASHDGSPYLMRDVRRANRRAFFSVSAFSLKIEILPMQSCQIIIDAAQDGVIIHHSCEMDVISVTITA